MRYTRSFVANLDRSGVVFCKQRTPYASIELFLLFLETFRYDTPLRLIYSFRSRFDQSDKATRESN